MQAMKKILDILHFFLFAIWVAAAAIIIMWLISLLQKLIYQNKKAATPQPIIFRNGMFEAKSESDAAIFMQQCGMNNADIDFNIYGNTGSPVDSSRPVFKGYLANGIIYESKESYENRNQ